MFSNPQDMFKTFGNYFSAFLKTEQDARRAFEKVRSIALADANKASSIWRAHQKSLTGDATPNEIAEANRKMQELLASVRFASLLAIPGAIFLLPVIDQVAKEFDVDIIPENVKQEFSL